MKERVAPLVRELYLKVKQFSENLDQLQGILSLSSSQKSSTIQE